MRTAVVLLALCACKMNESKHHDTDTAHTEVAPPGQCGSAGPSLALQDDASHQLVAGAIGKTNGAATIAITEIHKPDYGCNTGGFDGWEATARISGGDYALAGIVSYPPTTVPLARGAKDEWVTFPVGDPGYGHELQVGAVWRKQGDPTPVAVGAIIPARANLPPPPDARVPAEIGCDPAGPAIEIGPPLDADRNIHVGLAAMPKERTLPSHIELAIWVDNDTLGEPFEPPIVTTELGTVTRAGPAWDQGLPPRAVVFSLDARCPDLRVLPRRFTVTASWKIVLDGASNTYTTKVVLEQKADGSITRSGS